MSRLRATLVRRSPLIIFTVSVVYGLGLLLAWNRPLPVTSLDGSWGMVLQYATLHQWQFGKDIIFTYGPLCWLTLSEMAIHPDLLSRVLVGQAFLVFMAILATYLVAWQASSRASHRVAWAAILLLVLIEFGVRWHDTIFVAMPWLYLLLWFLRDGDADGREDQLVRTPTASETTGGRWSQSGIAWVAFDLGMASSLAMIALCKFTYTMMAVVAVIGGGLDAISRRRFPWQGLAFFVFCGVFWGTASQSLSSVIPYLRNSLEISRGYGMSMQIECPRWIVIGYFGASLLLLGGIVWANGALSRGRLILATVTLAGVLVFLLKASLTRACPAHVAFLAFPFPLLTLLTIAALWPQTSSPRRILPLGVVLVLTIFLLARADRRYIPPQMCGSPPISVRLDKLHAAVKTLSGKSDLPRRYREWEKKTAADWPKIPEKTTVDLYPFDAGILLAAGGNYRPRPVFQSYTAYTPALAAINAEHLRSEHAAQLIYFAIGSIDGQFPTLVDGRSWPELLSRYDLSSDISPMQCQGYLPLQRIEKPRPWKLELLEEREVALNEQVAVPVPTKGPIWIEVFAEPRRSDIVLNSLIREPVLMLQVDDATGSHDYRLPRGLGESGFLLSPLLEQTAWFAWMASTPWEDPVWQRWLAAERVQRMKLYPASPGTFRSPARVRFYHLKFENWNNRTLAFGPGQAALFEVLRDSQNRFNAAFYANWDQRLAVLPRPNAIVTWPVSESNTYAPLSPAASTIKVQYGLVPPVPRGKAGPPLAGFSFSLFTSDEQGNWKQLWSTRLDSTEADPFPCGQAEIPVRLTGAKAIALLTRKPDGDPTRLPALFGLRAE